MIALVRGRQSFAASLLARCKALIARLGLGWGHELKLGEAYRLGSSKVRLPLDCGPLEITLGASGRRLHLCPETRLNDAGECVRLSSYVIFDPAARHARISGFLRLMPRSWLSLGTEDAVQAAVFAYPPEVDGQHLVVIHGRDALIFRNLSDAGTAIGPAAVAQKWTRERKIRRLQQILGGRIDLLPPERALSVLGDVNRLLRDDFHRPHNTLGMPGGLVVLPPEVTPIILGDLHGQVDNLLTVLSRNAFLEALEAGTAALVILGDAVHSEVDGQLREMDSSLLLMDLILQLKLAFPRQVFYVRGNHDSFSEDIAKDGIPQGLLWAKALSDRRGSAYFKAMGEFYRQLPYVVVSTDFVACHAAAPKTETSREALINIHRHTSLIPELINNRLRRPNRPQGYARADVKRFRRSLQLEKHTPFIVGHTPVDRENTLWFNVDGITAHHVLYSAHPEQVGVFTRVDGMLVPLVYPVDALTAIINRTQSPSE